MTTMSNGNIFKYIWDGDAFTLENPLVHPSFAAGFVKKVIHQGSSFVTNRFLAAGVTSIQPSATFPTNRYLFEGTNAGASNSNTSQVTIDGFQAVNNTLFATKNVGFVKFEGGYVHNGALEWRVSNCYSQYMWRTLHLSGMVWWGLFENISIQRSNASFTQGDTDILVEDGGHTFPAINPSPKANIFRNINWNSGDSELNNAIKMTAGGYNIFENMFIDGYKYRTATIELNNTDALTIHNNTFQNVTVLDHFAPAVDTRIACLYLTGTSVYDNLFRRMRLYPYPIMARLASTGVMRNEIELAAYWGAAASINDTGAGEGNTYIPIAGAKTTTGDTAITHTGAVGRVIDHRRGASRSGNSFFSGNGTNKIFTIAHGVFKDPASVTVGMGQASTLGNSFWYNSDATNITVTFNTAPPSGTNNVTIRWRAEAYP